MPTIFPVHNEARGYLSLGQHDERMKFPYFASPLLIFASTVSVAIAAKNLIVDTDLFSDVE